MTYELIEDYGDGSEPRVCGTYTNETEVRRLATALNLTSLPAEPGDIDGPSYYVRTVADRASDPCEVFEGRVDYYGSL